MIQLQFRKPGCGQLLPDFIQGICGMKRCDEIPLQDRRGAFGVLLHKFDHGLMIRRTDQIDNHYRRARFRASGGSAPKNRGVGKVMEQAIRENAVEITRFQRRVRKIPLLQRDPRIKAGFANRTSAECEHRIRTIDAENGNGRKRLREPDCYVRRSAPKVDHAPDGELGKPLAKIARDLPM